MDVYTWVALTLETVSVKALWVFMAACVMVLTVGRRRPAVAYLFWVLAVCSFPLLTIQTVAGLGLPKLYDDGARAHAALLGSSWLHAVVEGYGLVVTLLLAGIIAAAVSHSLQRADSTDLPPYSHRLGPFKLPRSTAIRYCSQIAVPTTFGVFRPTILLPTAVEGMIASSLYPSALLFESIHVLRLDCLWLWITRVTQAFFFFHPAVWAASWAVRRASCHVCDDWAVSVPGSPGVYRETLRRLAAANPKRPFFGLDLPMCTTQNVPARTARLAGADYRPSLHLPSTWSRSGVAACLMFIAILGASPSDGFAGGYSARALIAGLATTGPILLAGAVINLGRRRAVRKRNDQPVTSGPFLRTRVDHALSWLDREFYISDMISLVARQGREFVLLGAATLVLLIGVFLAAPRLARDPAGFEFVLPRSFPPLDSDRGSDLSQDQEFIP